MTPQCGVRTALTEERSQAEIKTSALRRSDETKSSYPHKIQVVRNCVPLFSFAFDNWYANIILDNDPLL